MKEWYSIRDHVSTHLKIAHRLISGLLHPAEFDMLDRKVRPEINDIIHNMYEIQKEKINKLYGSKQLQELVETRMLAECVINLTDLEAVSEVLQVPGKGFKNFLPKTV